MGMVLPLDAYASAGIGVLALFLGLFFTGKLAFLKRFCIPAPVSGGLLISLTTLLLYGAFGVECTFDGSVKDLCMMLFFTSVGFQSDFRVLRKGGKLLAVMIGLVTVLIVAQNLIAVGIARGLDINPLFGLAAGSIPMSGGHGTAGGFSPLLEELGLAEASSITMAAATFGLVAGSLLGGPLGEALIRRHHLSEPSAAGASVESEVFPDAPAENAGSKTFPEYLRGACILIIAMSLGTGLSRLLAMTGITFPTYFGSLLVACLMRNLIGLSPRLAPKLHVPEIVSIGDVCLQLFLGMAMASLRLWELASLALPLTLILVAHVTFIALFGAFVAFPLLGKDYDSAVLVSGLCGFGLGATPNAMANMSAVCFKYRYAVKPFIIVPIVGAMFVDLINTSVITAFIAFHS